MKKQLILMISILMLVCFTGCDASVMNPIYDDDEKIARSSDSKVAVMSIGSLNGNEYSLSATMTGMQTVWNHDAAEGEELNVSYSLSVTEGGKVKLVLISPDKEVLTLTENTDHTVAAEMQTQTLTLSEGKYRIKVVGYESPKFELKLNTETGNLGSGS